MSLSGNVPGWDCNSYAGRAAIDRLIYIISLSPNLAPQAFKRALQLLTLPSQRDTEYYKAILGTYENVSSRPGFRLPPLEEILPDHSPYLSWIEETNERNNAEYRKLEVELKTYTGNMIKESIRMAYRDLSAFFRATGSFEGSLRHLTKSREYCSSTQDLLEMCLSVLEVATPLISFSPRGNLLTITLTASPGTTQLFAHTDVRLQSRVRSRQHRYVRALVLEFGFRVKCQFGWGEKDRSAPSGRSETCTLYRAFAPGERELRKGDARLPPADVRGGTCALER